MEKEKINCRTQIYSDTPDDRKSICMERIVTVALFPENPQTFLCYNQRIMHVLQLFDNRNCNRICG